MADEQKPSVIPTLNYDDATSAIEYLTKTFGFGEEFVHEGEDGKIDHALLAWGNSLVMLSTRVEGSPFALGPQCIYLTTDDPDGLHDRAVAAGADILMGLTDQDYGSREFAARDVEGNVWCFGTYAPAIGGAH
jgi:uncharacterized glyoxalase superfamily protein PhnB